MMAASPDQVQPLAEMICDARAKVQHQLALLQATPGQRAAVNRAAAEELLRLLKADPGCPESEAADWATTVVHAANRLADDVILLSTPHEGSA